MTAYFKPPKTDLDVSDTPECEDLFSRDILPNFRVQCTLGCSTFVLDEEVALKGIECLEPGDLPTALLPYRPASCALPSTCLLHSSPRDFPQRRLARALPPASLKIEVSF